MDFEEENFPIYENPIPSGLALYVNGPKHRRKRRKGKMPAGLAAYWAKKRKRKSKKQARKISRRRKRGSYRSRRIAAARTAVTKRRRRLGKFRFAQKRRKRRMPAGLAAYWSAKGAKKMAKKRRRKVRGRRGSPRRKVHRRSRKHAAPKRRRRKSRVHHKRSRRRGGHRKMLIYGRPVRMNPRGIVGAVSGMLKDGVPGAAVAALEELYVVDPVLALAKIPPQFRGLGVIGFGLIQAVLVGKFMPRMGKHAAVAFHGLLTSGLKETIAGFLAPATATKTADLINRYEGLVSANQLQPVNGLLNSGSVPPVMDVGDGMDSPIGAEDY